MRAVSYLWSSNPFEYLMGLPSVWGEVPALGTVELRRERYGSPSRIRTYGHSINSRMLYR